MYKKISLLFVLLFAVVAISGCTQPDDDMLYINVGDTIPTEMCYENGFRERVTVFYSTTCPACKATLPRLQLLEAKLTDVEFEYIALDDDEGRARIQELKISPYYVPAVIINCAVYGSMSQADYEEIIERTR